MRYLSPTSLCLFASLLLAFNFVGCKKDKKSDIPAPKPVTDFSISGNFIGGYYLAFYPNIEETPGATALWDFGDGTKSKDYKTGHVYEKAGSYTVTLVANGDTEQTIRRTFDIQVSYLFWHPSIALIGDTILFHFKYPVPDGNTYHWNFGDGTTATFTDSVVHHVYADSGKYQVTLTVNNDPFVYRYYSIRIFKDPLYTHQIAGSKHWHGVYTTDLLVDGLYTHNIGDSVFSITYSDPITISTPYTKYLYEPDSSDGNILFYQAIGASGYPIRGKITFDHATNNITLYSVFSVYPSNYTGPGHPHPITYQYYLSTP